VFRQERVGAVFANASIPARRLLRGGLVDRSRYRPVHVQVVGVDELRTFASDGLSHVAVEDRDPFRPAVVAGLQAVVDDCRSIAGGRCAGWRRYIKGVLGDALRGLRRCVSAHRAHLEALGRKLPDNSSPDAAGPTEHNV
jgi:hypothetical protein